MIVVLCAELEYGGTTTQMQLKNTSTRNQNAGLHIHVIIAAINVSLDSSSIMLDQDALTCERMCEVSRVFRLFLQLNFGRTGGTYW